MKRKLLCLVLAMVMIGAIAACAAPAPATPTAPDTPAAETPAAPADPDSPLAGKRIGVAHITVYDEWTVGVFNEFMRQGAEMGFGEINIQDGQLNAEIQQRQVEDFIAQQFDMIIIAPVSPEGILPTLQQAHDAGIPVLSFDSHPPFEHLVAHVAWDHAETGVLTANYIADYAEANLGGSVRVGILAMLDAPHTAIRSETFKQTLEARLGVENIEYVFEQDFGQTRESAANIVTNNIARPMDFIWAAVDNAAFGARVALQTGGVQGTRIVSAGAWGTEPFTTLYGGDPYYMMCIGVSPEEIVRLTLEAAEKYFTGRQSEIQLYQNIELSVIDEHNIENFMHFID